MRALLLSPLLLLATACSSPSPESGKDAPDPATPDAATATAAEPLDTARPAAVDAQTDTLLTARRRHLFSSPGSPDAFSLVLRGASVLTAEATLTITTAAGQVIFREVLSAPDLEAAMVYDMPGPTATQAEREAYVHRRIREFFADQNFRRPAVAAAATFPAAADAPAGTDRAAWDDLRRRPEAIGFQYLVGKEDRHTIAWSPLRKQVVRIP
ncbi:hypothetical protein HNQ93_000280 [Hymenobacter luteus]|uniref:Lipoprotein n=2 Tax=Hymenobacter TaxID=89966 RepID=A0A7W9SY02_9BACT|nr:MULTISPECIES: hypothetical protein [Hymenobacter]MBB4600240.1 hypothetical protein [Hymenobacter latericoloratus]MBB6057450.1 hypothetical protein [Hymenobacter luteus]